MEIFLLIIHGILALLVIVLVLLQQGKGAELGASFGAGSSQTLFGSQGSGSFFTKLTAIAMALFFITSLALTVLTKKKASIDYKDSDLAPLIQDDQAAKEKSPLPKLPDINTNTQTTTGTIGSDKALETEAAIPENIAPQNTNNKTDNQTIDTKEAENQVDQPANSQQNKDASTETKKQAETSTEKP